MAPCKIALLLACLALSGQSGCAFRGIRPSFELAGPVPPVTDTGGFEAALFETTGAQLRGGHRWTLEPDGQVFDAIVGDIAQARGSVNFVEYIWEPGDPSNRLLLALEKRQPGVACRILADPMGSPEFAAEVMPRLLAMGCEARVFRPLKKSNLFERNHRKLVIIDGRAAYLGGFGVREEWSAQKKRRRSFAASRGASRGLGVEWRDDNIRFTGPAVADAQRAFAQNWQEAGGALLPASDFPAPELAGENDARMALVSSSAGYLTESERVVHLLVAAAVKRVWIANAYFIPDESLQKLLVEKVRQGVDVRVLVPQATKNDLRLAAIGQKRTYARLLEGGVHIFEYEPVMMHAKTMIIDDRLAMIGSFNLNLISFVRLEEAALVIDDPRLVAGLDEEWRRDLQDAHAVKR
jgi:cardiolipin synthase